MSQDAVERLLGRMLTDDQFRYRAMQSLELACREGGYLLTAEELLLIRPADLVRFNMVAGSLDDGIKRYATP